METLADKMEAVDLPLIVEFLEKYDILTKEIFGFFEAGDGDGTLVDYPDAKNKLAEVFVILVGEDAVEDTRPKPIDV